MSVCGVNHVRVIHIHHVKAEGRRAGLQELVLHDNQLKQARPCAAQAVQLLRCQRQCWCLFDLVHTPTSWPQLCTPESACQGALTFCIRNKLFWAGQVPDLRAFGQLRQLELSYNELRTLAPLSSLAAPGLEELLAASNKLTCIEARLQNPPRPPPPLLPMHCIVHRAVGGSSPCSAAFCAT